MKALIASLLILLGLSACGAPDLVSVDTNAVHDEPNCTSVVDPTSPLCDAQHSQVVTCMLPEAIPSYATCAPGAGVGRGLVWCCEP